MQNGRDLFIHELLKRHSLMEEDVINNIIFVESGKLTQVKNDYYRINRLYDGIIKATVYSGGKPSGQYSWSIGE